MNRRMFFAALAAPVVAPAIPAGAESRHQLNLDEFNAYTAKLCREYYESMQISDPIFITIKDMDAAYRRANIGVSHANL